MNTTEAVAVLRAHNEWRRAEAPEIPDGIPDAPMPHSACDIGIAIDVLCDEHERLRAVADAAAVYYEHYVHDEADDVEACVCGREQHERAAALRDALGALPPSAPFNHTHRTTRP